MNKSLATLGVAGALLAIAVTPAMAATVTRSVTFFGHTITCTVTYTEQNGNDRLDTPREIRSITNVACVATTP